MSEIVALTLLRYILVFVFGFIVGVIGYYLGEIVDLMRQNRKNKGGSS